MERSRLNPDGQGRAAAPIKRQRLNGYDGDPPPAQERAALKRPKRTMLEAALDYAAADIPVFPVRLVGTDKIPLTQHSFKDATIDRKQIRAWWTKHRNAAIGMPTGKASGYDVVDTDIDEEAGLDGEAALAQLGELPSGGMMSQTPRGGFHRFFPHRDGVTNSRGSIPNDVGIDIRGDGGFVVLPPSRRPDGERYGWIRRRHLVADEMPEWLYARIKKQKPLQRPQDDDDLEEAPADHELTAREIAYLEAAVQNECEKLAAAPVGDRNNQLFRSAAALGGFVASGLLDRDQAWNALEEAAVACDLEPRETERTIKSGFQAGKQQPRQIPSDPDREDINTLAALPVGTYERERDEAAKRVGWRVSVLDRAVEKARTEKARTEKAGETTLLRQGFLAPVEPWPDPVDGAALLDELHDIIIEHVVISSSAVIATALWVLHAHTHDAARCSPILHPRSPEKRCGKTTLLSTVMRLAPVVLPAANVTAATIFRGIEKWHPTLLIDELDTFIDEKSELRGVLNSGHTRDTAFVLRCVGDNHTPELFSTWCPKVLASIGPLYSTLEDRSIIINMKRKLKGEKIARLPHGLDSYADTRSKCARWAADNLEKLRHANPALPEELHDRAQDNWGALIAIADLCGDDWAADARKAALRLSEIDEDETHTIVLLRDLRALFAAVDDGNLSSKYIVEELVKMEDRPWPEFKRGQAITPAGVAKLLKGFGIYPKQVVIEKGSKKQVKGYQPSQFTSVFERYLPL